MIKCEFFFRSFAYKHVNGMSYIFRSFTSTGVFSFAYKLMNISILYPFHSDKKKDTNKHCILCIFCGKSSDNCSFNRILTGIWLLFWLKLRKDFFFLLHFDSIFYLQMEEFNLNEKNQELNFSKKWYAGVVLCLF